MDQECLFSGRVEKVTLQKPILSLWDHFLVRCSLLSSFLKQMAVSGFLAVIASPPGEDRRLVGLEILRDGKLGREGPRLV